jgi:hypothetical protein
VCGELYKYVTLVCVCVCLEKNGENYPNLRDRKHWRGTVIYIKRSVTNHELILLEQLSK